jgi:hypothetical protein
MAEGFGGLLKGAWDNSLNYQRELPGQEMKPMCLIGGKSTSVKWELWEMNHKDL